MTLCGAQRNNFLLLSLLFAGLAFSPVLSGCAKNAAATAPKKFVQYEDFDKAFSCSAPDGWKRTQAGGGGMNSSVSFASGKTRIDVLSDLEGSLLADVSRAPGGTMPDIPQGMQVPPEMQAALKEASRPVIEKLHEAKKGKVGDSVTNYVEQPMKTINGKMGEGRCSEWTGNAGFMGGGDVHGYRATLLSGERRIRFVCRCPKSDWKTLQPAFDKVLASLAPATGGR